jgi:hypothetical protein
MILDGNMLSFVVRFFTFLKLSFIRRYDVTISFSFFIVFLWLGTVATKVDFDGIGSTFLSQNVLGGIFWMIERSDSTYKIQGKERPGGDNRR